MTEFMNRILSNHWRSNQMTAIFLSHLHTGDKVSTVFLDVIEQRHETEVHVHLLMAVEKSETGIVGNKVDFVDLVDPEHHNILHDTGRGDSGEISELKAVAMKMDRMNVVAVVAHTNAITFALL